MRRFMFVLALAALAPLGLRGTAQEVAGGKKAELIPAPAVVAPAPVACEAPCVSTYKACVAVPDVKKHSKVVYGCECKDYCLPKCSLFGGLLGHGCNDCALGSCGHPKTKRVLMKKVVTEECPSFKCVVEERVKEDCPTKCVAPCPTTKCCSGTVAAGEPVPAMPVAAMPTIPSAPRAVSNQPVRMPALGNWVSPAPITVTPVP